jgi:uncharacterized membrane protein
MNGLAMTNSKTRYWWTFFIVNLIGLVDSVYLLWIKIANDKAYCLQGVGDCWTVNTSKYSSIFGIPVSVFGIIGYTIILLVFLYQKRNAFLQNNAVTLLFGLTLAGLLYSAYLTYIELYVIYAICPFCVISAVAMVVLFVLSVYRLVKGQTEI